MKQYICVKRLVVPELYDYEGEHTGNDFIVEVGEVWHVDEYGGMEQPEKGSWLDIGEITREEHFELLESDTK